MRRSFFDLRDEPETVDTWPITLVCSRCGDAIDVYVFPPEHLADLYPYECSRCISARLDDQPLKAATA